VVEIGPGTGALTEYLVDRYEDFTAVEIDHRAVAELRQRYRRIRVLEMDILDFDYGMLSSADDDGPVPIWVIGNLPYNITSQILFGLFEAPAIRQAVLTMQKEVAERLVAQPRTKAYGILSVVTQLLARPSICFHISPNVFRPKPEVWSSTVRLDWPPAEPLPDDVSPAWLKKVVRTAFNQRRKTLRNSLRILTDAAQIDLPDRWTSRRAEELEPHEYVELARILVVSGHD
jgi:16S rRNA (adenine1518-N6/adenine1519-N6)-dimethyltransferase